MLLPVHPEDADLRRHLLEALRAGEARRLERHLSACRACTARAARLSGELEQARIRLDAMAGAASLLRQDWPRLMERARAAQPAAAVPAADFLGGLARERPLQAAPERAAELLRALTGVSLPAGLRPEPGGEAGP